MYYHSRVIQLNPLDFMQIITNIRSPNFEARPAGCTPSFIILHYTEMLFDDAIAKLCDPESKVSAHYVVHKDGTIYNLVSDEYRAWHAGASYWNGVANLNDHSIGIEIDNMGDEAFTDAQMQSVIKLSQFLMNKYNIPRENVIGHSDIAPDRKVDPGAFFDWKMLDKNGIGIPMIHNISSLNIADKQKYLKNMGYKIEVTGENDKQTQFVMKAFTDHFGVA